jgi:pimeloyl-ACP methyl ester carboxylesterase
MNQADCGLRSGDCGLKSDGKAVETCPAIRNPQSAIRNSLARLDREAVQETFDGTCYRLPYMVWGQGPTLLIVPGLASDARCFALVGAELCAQFRCIACDWPAGGGRKSSRLDLGRLAGDLIGLLDHLEENRSHILGFSLGSTLALTVLAGWPGRFQRAVLASGFARRPLAAAEVMLLRLLRHWRGPMRRLPLHDTLLRRSHHLPFAEHPPELWRFFLRRCGAVPVADFAERALLLHDADLRPILKSIRHPVLLVTGDLDPLVPAACREVLQHGLSNARHVELSGAGHYALLTHPGLLAEVVRCFLAPVVWEAEAPAAPPSR